MPLPGKLCIGVLEEDNPLKSYFCFKPLLIEENGVYVPFENHAAYPEDGCIRIVPDKNESSHFKARMRRIGLYAVVDLREHPNDNDKIRLNKNYHGDDTERNAHIIYSDVVREPAPDMIFSVLKLRPEEAETACLSEQPGTQKVMLCPGDALLDGAWVCETAEGEDSVRLRSESIAASAADMQLFELPGCSGKTLTFAIVPPTKVDHVAEPALVKPSRTAPAPAAAPQPEVRKEIPEVRPAPVPEVKAPEPAPAAPAQDKPWISRSETFAAQRAEAHGSHPFAAQSGLNPRRSRTLAEIIDEKWKHSRLEQLGHSTEGISTDQPVSSPIENVVNALKNLWSMRDQRDALTDAIVHLDGADIAMDARRTAIRESAVTEQLNELEAQRLKMLSELDEMKRNRGTLRETLKQEIRRDEAAAFADAVQKTEKAQAERDRYEAEASRAKSAAQSVTDALNAMTDGRFEKRLQEFAVSSRAVELLRKPPKAEPVVQEITGCAATAEELILRVRTAFADAGCSISQTDAVNLLICAAQSPMLIVSGTPGSGKTTAVRLLSRALGIEAERLITAAPGKDSLDKDESILRLHTGEVPAVVLLDDANLIAAEDPTRGLYPAAESGKILLCATVQDQGHPVPASALARAFTVRLAEEAPDSPWQPKEASAPKQYAPVAREALKSAFAPTLAALPANVTKRMDKLRSDLAVLGIRLSRGTLNALWRYCAAAIPLMPIEPSAVLDMALAQRAIPAILASAPIDALAALPKLLSDLPRCKALLDQPLPVEV
ncbi:MAG: hypothetical protein IJO98_08340 [Clostridia bacterium]|nr:hypothetical protein [Clostridia bacterium]